MLGRMMASAIALTGVAYAQTTAPAADGQAAVATAAPVSSSDRVAYDAGYFAQYNPQTALDMVSQTPGFTLDGGDGRRGFSGAVGNILIDGVRPTAKSQSLDSILSRIPAGQVVRVELLRGAEISGDASGASVLLNIVRTASAGSGVYEVGFEYSGQAQERIAPQFDISYNGRIGQFEWGVGTRLISQNRNTPGERVFLDGAGVYGGRALLENPRDLWDPYVSGNMAFPLLGGRFSATGQINPEWYFEADNDFRFRDAADAPTANLFSHFKEEGTNYEIGLNYDRDIGPWALAMVGLITRNHYLNHEVANSTDEFEVTEQVTTQHIDRQANETIFRTSISRPLTPQHRIEIGGEGALNTLDSALLLTVDDGGGPDILNIPNSNVTVEEQRAEFFAAHTWRPNDLWSVESRIAWETSTLTFTGDANQETELAFWKPSLQVTRSFAGNNQLRARIYRDVGQLNFDDFVSAAGITDNIINGGNPNLQPQTDWRTEIGGDLRMGAAALSFTLTHHDITDVNDVVLIIAENEDEDPMDPDDDFIRFDAPGNIGGAEALSLDINFSTPLTYFLPGARLTIEGEFWDTEVTDPVTGGPRIISGQPESEVEVDFRQDFTAMRWSWGVHAYKQGENQSYRFNEIDTFEEGPWIDLWVETTALPNNMKLRLTAANIANGTINRRRLTFDTDRNGPLILRQITERDFETSPWFILELTGTF